jgi:hypothetical protein
MNTHRVGSKFVLSLLIVLTIASLASMSAAQDASAKPAVTVAQLAGTWHIALTGETGCGQGSLLFVGTLSSSGTADGTMTESFSCASGSTSQTFSIISLNSDGSGTAGLTCGSDCGWTFQIQVAPSRQVINLVDVTDPYPNDLTGTAVKQ